MARFKGFKVALEEPINEEQKIIILNCLNNIRGVAKVTAIEENILDDDIVEMKVKARIRRDLLNFIKDRV